MVVLCRGIDNTIQYITGFSMQAEIYGNTANARCQTQLTGFQGRVNIRAKAGKTSTADLACAISANPPFFWGSGGTETIVNLRGVSVTNQGAGGVTNAYGIYVLDQSGATTLNYAIYTNAAANGARFGHQLEIIGSTDVNQLKVTGFTTQTLPVGYLIDNTAATNVVRDVLKLETQSTGTAAAGLGAGLLFSIETAAASTMQTAAQIAAVWTDATNATRKAKLQLIAYDTAARLGLEIEASGTAAKLGFYGHATAIQPSAYTITNDSADRALDCNSTTLDELADVVGSLVKDLQSIGILG